MGVHMATNLQKATCRARHPRSLGNANISAAGAKWASPKSLAPQSEVIFKSLPGPPSSTSWLRTQRAASRGWRKAAPGLISPPTHQRWYAGCTRCAKGGGLDLLDAPVKSGRLAIWVGGEEAIFNAHKQVLDAFSDAARYIGPIGAGSVPKLETAPVTASKWFWRRCSRWGSKPGSSPSPYGKPCAPGRRRKWALSFANAKFYRVKSGDPSQRI